MTVPKSLRGRTLQDRYFPQRLNRKLGIQVLLQSVALIAEPLPDGLKTFGNFAEFRRGFSAVRSKARKLGLNKAALPTVTSPREPKPAPKPKPLSAAVTADPAPAATALPGFRKIPVRPFAPWANGSALCHCLIIIPANAVG
jgi:hypothetical protein